jgi:glutaconyl-CoA/methylmalonyl-CoA decarboxylase subunit gamma
MKVIVRIDDEQYEVEVKDLYNRPVIAEVDGETFEVWPEIGPAVQPAPAGQPPRETSLPPSTTPSTPPQAVVVAEQDANAVYAPIPGVIVSVGVQPGDVVETGQVLCMLEAMKMKNAIRAPRDGEIGTVHVTGGEHVQHNDLLVEYAD